MPYTVDRFQSNAFEPGWPVIINDATINATSTSLKLWGRGTPNYGELVAENFIHLLEHFAGPIAPINAITGQLWYDADPGVPDQGIMKIYNGTAFVPVGGIETDTTTFFTNPLSGVEGNLRYYVSPNANRLYAHDGTQWNAVGGLTLAASGPVGAANEGDFWYNTTNSNLSIRANNGWLNVVTSTVIQNPDSGTISAELSGINIVAVVADGQVIVVFSEGTIPNASLPTNFDLLNGGVANLQTLFPNGLLRGANFSNILGNSIRGNASIGENFDITNHSGGNIRIRASNGLPVTLGGPVADANIPTILIAGSANEINMSGHIRFTSSQSMTIPVGTSTQRTPIAELGDFRLNSDSNQLEYYAPTSLAADVSGWVTIDPTGAGGGDGFATSTRMLFHQLIPPSGWNVVTGLNDASIRIVNSGSVGGSDVAGQNFTTVFTSGYNIPVSGFTSEHELTLSEMPRHGHGWVGNNRNESSGRINPDGGFSTRNAGQFIADPWLGEPQNSRFRSIGGAGGYLVSAGNPGQYNTSGHSHGVNFNIDFNLNIKYINVIVGQKS